MKGFYVPAAFEVIRDPQRCVSCRLCIEQCPNGVHSFDEKRGVLLAAAIRLIKPGVITDVTGIVVLAALYAYHSIRTKQGKDVPCSKKQVPAVETN